VLHQDPAVSVKTMSNVALTHFDILQRGGHRSVGAGHIAIEGRPGLLGSAIATDTLCPQD
jgi:hypothetical protein